MSRNDRENRKCYDGITGQGKLRRVHVAGAMGIFGKSLEDELWKIHEEYGSNQYQYCECRSYYTLEQHNRMTA